MYAAMPGHEEALAASARIAAMVEPNYESLGLGRRCFPSFQPAGRQDARGLPARALRGRACTSGTATDPAPRCIERLDHELGIINRMGFASYFLIVWDFVRYARERGIPALGPRLGLRGHSSATCSSSATSARSSTTCSSSGSSTRIAPRRPTSTSTCARSGATRSSSTSARSTATPTSRRSAPSARSRPRRRSRTSAGR